MPAIVTGTVVRWEVKKDKKNKKDAEEAHVKYNHSEDVRVYVVNQNAEAAVVVPAIIATYILQKQEEEEQDPVQLLHDAAKGLLQVVGIEWAAVTPPPVPWEDE
jgi:PHD/YefM family antitoxin component YafN of YafNO toxin-antitoxin module